MHDTASSLRLSMVSQPWTKLRETWVSGARDRAIVGSTIALGHSLGLVVVAEGVEDRATFELLRELGCDLIQGHVVARPMLAAELIEWIADRQAGSPTTMSLL